MDEIEQEYIKAGCHIVNAIIESADISTVDVGLTCQRYDCDYRVIKPFLENLQPKKTDHA